MANIVSVKGTMINVALLVFNEHNVEEQLEKALDEKVVQKASFFSGLPFIIDFNEINDLTLHDVAMKTIKILKENDIHAIGVRCSDNQWTMLERIGFYYRDTSQSKRELIAEKTEKEEPKIQRR